MERICDEAGRGEPLRADPQLVRAWKASELISLHMNALDLISNPSMLEKKPHKTVGFYKIADKLYQIYKPFADDAKVSFCLTGRSFRKVLIDDGTFHIVMSVFIDNAIKYSKPGDRVEIQVLDASLGDALIVGCKVISLGPTASPAEERLFFTKQLRTEMAQQHTSQGSGIGLVLAKRVADQHRGTVRAKQVVRQEGRSEWTFLFQMIAVSE